MEKSWRYAACAAILKSVVGHCKEKKMRYGLLVLPLLVSACTSSPAKKPDHPQVGMANPAAVYCQQRGGERVPVQSPQGVRTECKLPGGEVIDEWALWRRDHPTPGS
jgi:putative hemolysin